MDPLLISSLTFIWFLRNYLLNNLHFYQYLPYAPLNEIILLFYADNWCKKIFLLKDTKPTNMFLGSLRIVFISVYFNAAISSSEIHKSIMKNTPFYPTLLSTYYSTALIPIYDINWFIAPQKLQLHDLVCLFLAANGLSAALQAAQIGAVTFMGFTGTMNGE